MFPFNIKEEAKFTNRRGLKVAQILYIVEMQKETKVCPRVRLIECQKQLLPTGMSDSMAA